MLETRGVELGYPGAMVRAALSVLSVVSVVSVLGCSSDTSTSSPSSTDAGADVIDPLDHEYGGDRPVPVFRAPEGHDPKEPLPLVVLLHGYGAGAIVQSLYFGLETLVDREKFLLIAPEGTPDSQGKRFWNAVDTCCDFEGRGVDDVRYLLDLVETFAARHPVDRRRVYAVGLSNGGAMALRLACDAADRIAAAVSFAGTFWEDAARCTPKVPVSIRHLHGTADRVVPYGGGSIVPGIHPKAKGTLPSAQAIVSTWAKLDGCTKTEDAPPLDLDPALAGAETTVVRHAGCAGDSVVELLTLHGGVHVPRLGPAFAASTWAFLSAHVR